MDYCGIDLHQDESYSCTLDEEGEVTEQTTVRTIRRTLSKYFEVRARMWVVIEAGITSPWVSHLVEKCDPEIIEEHGGWPGVFVTVTGSEVES